MKRNNVNAKCKTRHVCCGHLAVDVVFAYVTRSSVFLPLPSLLRHMMKGNSRRGVFDIELFYICVWHFVVRIIRHGSEVWWLIIFFLQFFSITVNTSLRLILLAFPRKQFDSSPLFDLVFDSISPDSVATHKAVKIPSILKNPGSKKMAGTGGDIMIQLFSCCIQQQPSPTRRRHQRLRIDRSMIGNPTNFVHTGEVDGWKKTWMRVSRTLLINIHRSYWFQRRRIIFTALDCHTNADAE